MMVQVQSNVPNRRPTIRQKKLVGFRLRATHGKSEKILFCDVNKTLHICTVQVLIANLLSEPNSILTTKISDGRAEARSIAVSRLVLLNGELYFVSESGSARPKIRKCGHSFHKAPGGE